MYSNDWVSIIFNHIDPPTSNKYCASLAFVKYGVLKSYNMIFVQICSTELNITLII